MGFEILPVEEGDIDEMRPKYDVFELTSAQKWVPARFCTSPAVHVEDYAMEQLPEDPSMEHKLQEPTIEYLPKEYAMEHLIEEEPSLEYFPEDDPPMESLTIEDLPMEHLNQKVLHMDCFVRGLYDSFIEGRSDIQGSFIFDPGPTSLTFVNYIQ